MMYSLEGVHHYSIFQGEIDMHKQTKYINMTQEGYDKLLKELRYLQTTRKSELAADMKIARGFGDISENAEYQSVRQDMVNLDMDIAKLELKLSQVKIIDASKLDKTKIHLGSKFHILDIDFDEKEEYTLVANGEVTDPFSHISVDSPLGQALINKCVGESVIVDTPNGKRSLKILKLVG